MSGFYGAGGAVPGLPTRPPVRSRRLRLFVTGMLVRGEIQTMGCWERGEKQRGGLLLGCEMLLWGRCGRGSLSGDGVGRGRERDPETHV